MPGKFMVTTPIYYSNAPAHLGHAYTSLACDVLARWHRLRGDEVFFLTGLDEHGGNIEKVAKEAGTTPQTWCDRIAADDLAFFRELGLTNDDFIRTTEDRHRVATEAFWKAVSSRQAPDGKPNIYKGEYIGWYCAKCEAYFAEGELLAGNCPIHGTPAEQLKEETYFFHLSGYQGELDKLFEVEAGKPAEQRFVYPETRFNEVRGILREGLRDISISRTKVGWGFPVPGDPSHVIYVWFDALINYLTGAGYPDRGSARWPFWGSVIHVMAKEIIRFHALLWPAMLMAADVPLPRKVVVHGWWTVEGDKMSKSKGNVVNPCEFAREFSLDSVRYFLLREIEFGVDGDFSRKRFIERYNSDLANDIGNLAHRTISMAFRYLEGKVKRTDSTPWEGEFMKRWGGREAKVREFAKAEGLTFTQAAFMVLAEDGLSLPQFQQALADIWELAGSANKFIDTEAPWKKDKPEQERILGQVLEVLEAASWPMLAFIPDTAMKLRAQLGLTDVLPPKPVKRGALPAVFSLTAGDPLFPRIDTKKKPV